jgi:hypothetical protein
VKKLLILIIFIFIANLIYSQAQISLLPSGMGINIAEDKTVSMDFEVNIGYFSMDWPRYFPIDWLIFDLLYDLWYFTGIGIIWVPVNYRYFSDNHYISIINFQAYWNIFHFTKAENWQNSIFIGGAVFGPFVSINYAPNLNFNKYILCTGIKYNLTGGKNGDPRFYLFNIECGYKLIDDKNNFYFGLNIDIIWAYFFIFGI